ncbi:MAG: spore coat protein CotJB [Acutalibacteraceae bacterium]|jgi:spore coat protein JB
MTRKAEAKKRIHELDFAIHELVLFLDTHPTNMKALGLLNDYRMKRKQAIDQYEANFGKYIDTASEVPVGTCWKWLDGPWPWENNFMED